VAQLLQEHSREDDASPEDVQPFTIAILRDFLDAANCDEFDVRHGHPLGL
jgi:hypothetical protein